MKKIVLALVSLLTVFSCQEGNRLEEVQIPEPEVVVQTKFANPKDFKATGLPFNLTPIDYTFEDFPDFADGKTLEFHYTRVYLNFTNVLNNLVTEKNWETKKVSQICREINPEDKAFLHAAGGFYNHNLFFENLTPKKDSKRSTDLEAAIVRDFGSFTNFKNQFTEKSIAAIGSNWVWLIVNNSQKLEIVTTLNEENPLMQHSSTKGTPLLCLDLWEHAYILNERPSKKNYIDAFFNYIDWEKVSEKYEIFVPISPQP